uniref:Uncharacterized protein n=1 Tax=Ditylenchus dipsaci TaxID=166011 RepID=A0A915ENU4_9BILA
MTLSCIALERILATLKLEIYEKETNLRLVLAHLLFAISSGIFTYVMLQANHMQPTCSRDKMKQAQPVKTAHYMREDAEPISDKFQFDPMTIGIFEVLFLFAALATFFTMHKNSTLSPMTGIYIIICAATVVLIASITTAIMVYGITAEKPHLLLPQITFLHVEIILLLLGAAGSIASMSLGIEWTYSIFAPFVSIPKMERDFGPIWPFNVAIVAFSGAALGIWFHVIVQGCYDYLLDKNTLNQLQSHL